MRQTHKIIAVVAALLVLAVKDVRALEVGMPFGFGNNMTFATHGGGGGSHWGADIGMRLHFSGMFALQPNLSLASGEGYTNLGVNIDALFYLFESNDVKMYLGAAVGLNITDDNDDNLRLGGIFGVQHPLTGSVDLFAQTGIGLRLEPGRFYTVNTHLGVIFYLIR